LESDQEGRIADKLMKKGVLSVRRDNNRLMRQLYDSIIEKIFDNDSKEDILEFIIDELNKFCSATFPIEDFIISKSVGELKDYKRRALPDDPKKYKKRLEDLRCSEDEYYYVKALPAHVQLAERMRRRGQIIEAGTRIEYVITTEGGPKARLFDKIEDPDYVKEHSEILKIDYLQYLNTYSKQLDELLEVGLGVKKFIGDQYKLRLQKYKFCEQIVRLFQPDIIFE